jgi:hypothetical protein
MNSMAWTPIARQERRGDAMKRSKRFLSAAFLIALASCAGFSTTVVPDTNFAPGASVQAAISTYYRDHAVEYDTGPCYRPYFDAITKVDVIEQDADHLVLELRYSFRDRLRDDEDTNRIPPSSRRVCWGFESRQFTLSKETGVVRVTEMTGPRRGASAVGGGVTLGGNLRVGIGSRMR